MTTTGTPSSSFNRRRVFATTSWTRIVSATDENSSETESALAELCEIYWFPLYAFVRRKDHSKEEAEDITQAFFVQLLENRRLAMADVSRGKFRTFLLSSLTNFMANWHRDQSAEKRGGGKIPFSIDFAFADQRFGEQPSEEITAEKAFERTWAMELLASAMAAVCDQYESTDKSELFAALQPFLAGGADRSMKELAEQLEMTEGSAKVALHRLRQRYGDQLRLQIARTLHDPKEVDDELRSLFQALEC